jgi:peroxiredoxin
MDFRAHKNRYAYAAAGLLALALAWLAASPGRRGPSPGSPAPDVLLAELSGRALPLAQTRGKVVLLDFWATWCDSCAAEVPGLKDLQARLAGRDFVLLAASVDDKAADVAAFAARERPPYRVLLADSSASDAYGVWELPTKFLIDRDGRVARRYAGGADLREIESDIIRLLERRSS